MCVCVCVCVHAQTGCITFLASTSPLQPSQRYWLRPSSSSISTKLSFNLFSREPPPDRATGRSRNSSCADNNYIIHVPQELARNLPAQTYYIAAMWRKPSPHAPIRSPAISSHTKQGRGNINTICFLISQVQIFYTYVPFFSKFCILQL